MPALSAGESAEDDGDDTDDVTVGVGDEPSAEPVPGGESADSSERTESTESADSTESDDHGLFADFHDPSPTEETTKPDRSAEPASADTEPIDPPEFGDPTTADEDETDTPQADEPMGFDLVDDTEGPTAAEPEEDGEARGTEETEPFGEQDPFSGASREEPEAADSDEGTVWGGDGDWDDLAAELEGADEEDETPEVDSWDTEEE
jgi:hypothetical protein